MTTWLFRPFTRVAGGVAFGAGVFVLIATALIGWSWQGVYTDGVLDLHIGPASPLGVFLTQAGVAWLLLPATVVVGIPWYRSTVEESTKAVLQTPQTVSIDMFAAGVVGCAACVSCVDGLVDVPQLRHGVSPERRACWLEFRAGVNCR